MAVRQSTKERMLSLDVIRGIALCGIAFVNVQQQWGMYPGEHGDTELYRTLEILAHRRFFPVFTFLFGIGFAMIMAGARRRGLSEASVMVRRLFPLLLLGAAHQFLHPGEALFPYASIAFGVLFPLAYVEDHRRRRTIATWGGIVLTVVGGFFGGVFVIPGLLMLGFAFAEWGLPKLLDVSPSPATKSLALLIPLTVALSVVQLKMLGTTSYFFVANYTGLVFSAMVVALTYTLLRTPLRGALGAVFAPLGRMALTNYIVATFVIHGARMALGITVPNPNATNADFATGFAVMAVMLAAQVLLSTWWLSRFGQGPLEKAWRYLTWEAFGGPKPLAPKEAPAQAAPGHARG